MGGTIMSTNVGQKTGETVSATGANFKALVLESDLPVLVDFWAPWCGPCRAIGPVLEEVAAEYAGQAKVVKVNVDEEPQIAASLGVRSIPTLVLFDRGEPREAIIGLRPKGEITALLDRARGA
jgi:thioredoxin 1